MAITQAELRARAAALDLLAALKNVIDSAVTDSDSCALCGSDWRQHASGCAVVVAIDAVKKAEGA